MPRSRLLLVALALAPAAALASCSSSGTSSTGSSATAGSSGSGAGSGAAGAALDVTLTDNGCSQATYAAKAGEVKVTVKNTAGGEGEFEILQNGQVKGEAEGLAPGFTKSFTAKLDPGEYDLICVSDEKPKPKLTVS